MKEKISLTWMKNQAKKLKRVSDKTHTQCLDIVAKEYGFENYREAYRKLRKLPNEKTKTDE